MILSAKADKTILKGTKFTIIVNILVNIETVHVSKF